MKKYFAKYLPVEGEIKLNKPFFEKDKLIMGWDNPHDMTYINEKKYIQAAKLSLCSRDIQIGDKFQQNPASFPAYISNCIDVKDGFAICDEDRKWTLGTIFKVIGEISLEATWVKEGMEFDEGEVYIKYHVGYECLCEKTLGYEDENCTHYKGGVNKYVDGCYREIYKSTAYEIKVKGPCGHFH